MKHIYGIPFIDNFIRFNNILSFCFRTNYKYIGHVLGMVLRSHIYLLWNQNCLISLMDMVKNTIMALIIV